MVVAVCSGGVCAEHSEPVLDALRPVIRAEPGAVLMRTTCLDAGCDGHSSPVEHPPRVRIQPWTASGDRAAGRVCQLEGTDQQACARLVASWLRRERLRG